MFARRYRLMLQQSLMILSHFPGVSLPIRPMQPKIPELQII